MSPAIPLLLFSTTALAAVALSPRPGEGVMLALAPGVAAEAAFAATDWRIRSVRGFGPMTLVLAFPETPSADPARFRRMAGAVLAILAAPRGDCSSP